MPFESKSNKSNKSWSKHSKVDTCHIPISHTHGLSVCGTWDPLDLEMIPCSRRETLLQIGEVMYTALPVEGLRRHALLPAHPKNTLVFIPAAMLMVFTPAAMSCDLEGRFHCLMHHGHRCVADTVDLILTSKINVSTKHTTHETESSAAR